MMNNNIIELVENFLNNSEFSYNESEFKTLLNNLEKKKEKRLNASIKNKDLIETIKCFLYENGNSFSAEEIAESCNLGDEFTGLKIYSLLKNEEDIKIEKEKRGARKLTVYSVNNK